MSQVYLSLGSNLGQRESILLQAIEEIKKQIGNVISQSAFYATAPWGFHSEHEFLNAALCCTTALSPLQVLDITQKIERQLGRKHKSVNGQYEDRPIDIDILLYDDQIIKTPRLTVPHPLMHKRDFVLKPMCEIAPQFQHPVLHQTMEQLLQQQSL